MTATNTWLMEVEYEDGEVFTHRIHHDPRDEAWECVFPTAVAVRFSPVPAQESQSESVAAPAEAGQGQGTHSLQDFSDWLALRLNQAQRGSYPNRLSGESDSSYKFRCDEVARALCLVQCLILGFKLEHGV